MLTGQQVLGLLLSLPLQNWDQTHTHTHTPLLQVLHILGDHTRALMFANTLPTRLCLQPLKYVLLLGRTQCSGWEQTSLVSMSH